MKQKLKPFSLFTIFILAIVISTVGIVIAADGIQTGNTTNDSFNKSKQLLHSVIYKDAASRQDIYCGCKYDEKKEVDFNSCGYKPEKDNKRAHRITASVFINDDESGLHKDYEEWLEKLAPHEPISKYLHNRTGENNGDAHLKRQIMGREVVIAVTNGKLDFGP